MTSPVFDGSVRIDRAQPEDVKELFARSTALFDAAYPAESNHLVPSTVFLEPGNYLLGAFDGHRAVGCVGWVGYGNWAEIKRLIVDPDYRRQGIATVLLSQLELAATDSGFDLLRLETGIDQSESLRLYERLGFRARGPFGDYRPDPLSVFYEKNLPTANKQGASGIRG